MIFDDQKFVVYDTGKENIEDPINSFSFNDGSIFSSDNIKKVKVVEWSSDNRHVLVKHTFQKKDEYLLIDIEDESKTINLNRTIKGFDNVKKLALFDKQPNELFVLNSKNDLIRIRVSDGRKTAVEKDVIDYKSYSTDRVVFIKNSTVSKSKADVFCFG